jgi:hypothetical protein
MQENLLSEVLIVNYEYLSNSDKRGQTTIIFLIARS